MLAAFMPGASARESSTQKLAAETRTTHEGCHFEGANICPPEDLEIVWMCFTHTQLAGYECPDLNEHLKVVNSQFRLVAAAGDNNQAALPQGSCSGVAECNQFIADCVGAGGEYVPEHNNPQGQPNLGSCGPAQD